MFIIKSHDELAKARADHPTEIICLEHDNGTRTIWRPGIERPFHVPVVPEPRYTNKPQK